MLHKLDGKLVGVGEIELLDSLYNSAYFIYDPEFSFLHLGVVSAVMEMQYMKMIKEKGWFPNMKYYYLGEMVVTCPKVNYKLGYKPGMVTCPKTKALVYYEDVKD
jgi:arginine-tRNA-protein transferase